MNTPVSNPFHARAIDWLREKMALQTETMPTNSVAIDGDAARAHLDGWIARNGSNDSLGFLAMMSALGAMITALASARMGADPAHTVPARWIAIILTIACVLLVAFDAWRSYRRRMKIDVMVVARDGSIASAVDRERLDHWRASANGQLWIVSEIGFTPEALAAARAKGMRCFALGRHGIEEVDPR